MPDPFHLVLFDIDGTLIDSNRLDDACFVAALREVFSIDDFDTDWAGTDCQVADLQQNTHQPRPPFRLAV